MKKLILSVFAIMIAGSMFAQSATAPKTVASVPAAKTTKVATKHKTVKKVSEKKTATAKPAAPATKK
jgi:hypothetical protein